MEKSNEMQAHDVPAAKLRERLAQAANHIKILCDELAEWEEREAKASGEESFEKLIEQLRERLAQAERELAEAKRENERLRYVDKALKTITGQRNDIYRNGISFGRATASGTWMTLDTCCVCRDIYPRDAMAQVDDEKYQCADCLQAERDQYHERIAALEGQLDISTRHVKWISKAREFWVKTAQDQEERASELQAERDTARAEAADLRARLADEDARWHTLADGYAGAMRELAEVKRELKKLLSECRILVDRKTIRVGPPHPDDDHWIWKDLLKRIDSALQPEAQRPEAEGREG